MIQAPSASATYRLAPPGFTAEQRAAFDRDGFLTIENAIAPDDVQRLIDAIDRQCAADPKYRPDTFYSPQNIVELDPVFAELIDHERHVGYAYDLYGELTKLQQSQFMCRPRGGWHNLWHPDGPRALPYGAYCGDACMQLKFGYWLTDLPTPKMGNLVVRPGSHREQYFDHYDTHDSVGDEHIVCVKAGTMTLLHANTWHRVEPNESDVTRKNVFITYCPSWIANQDRWHSDPDWLATLSREQQILMRSYAQAYDWCKPKADQFPLFLDRETGGDRDAGVYRDHVELHRRKRRVAHEKA